MSAGAEHPIPRAWGLTPFEARVLLALHAARTTLSTSELMERLYSCGRAEPDPQIIAVYVSKIRRKLGLCFPDFRPPFITAVWGKGYRIDEEARALLTSAAALAAADSITEPKGLAA